MVGCNGGLRAGGDTSNFSIRVETTKVVKNCLKSTLVAEISGTKVPKKGNLLPLTVALYHIAFLSKNYGPMSETLLAPRSPTTRDAKHRHVTPNAVLIGSAGGSLPPWALVPLAAAFPLSGRMSLSGAPHHVVRRRTTHRLPQTAVGRGGRVKPARNIPSTRWPAAAVSHFLKATRCTSTRVP